METVHINSVLILAAANSELKKASEKTAEVSRLAEIGYLNSQTGLDVATEVRAHLVKAYELLAKINTLEAMHQMAGIKLAIEKQDTIIWRIRYSLT